jgi:DNA-binding MarR family transcriptional regulator
VTSKRSATFPKTSAWNRPGFLLWHAVLRWQRAAAAALAPTGLTHTQFRMLTSVMWLQEHQGADPSQREVADHTGADVMVTSQVVRTLERAGYLERVGDEHDARVRRLRTTEEGRAMALRTIALIEAVDDEFFGTSDTREVAIEVLRELAGRDADGNITDARWPRSN